MKKLLLLSVFLIFAAGYSQGEDFKDVNERLSPFQHEKGTVEGGQLIRVGEYNGIVKVGESLMSVPLAELPEPQRKRYWTDPREAILEQAREAQAKAKWDEESWRRKTFGSASKPGPSGSGPEEKPQAAEPAIRYPEKWFQSSQSTTAKQSEPGPLAGLMILFVAGIIYFLPSIVGRHSRNSQAIILLNLLLGWTVLGWVAALIWAVYKERPLQNPGTNAAPADTSPASH